MQLARQVANQVGGGEALALALVVGGGIGLERGRGGAVLGGATQVTAVAGIDRRHRVRPQGSRGLQVGSRPAAPIESPSLCGGFFRRFGYQRLRRMIG